jgi:hypothetical protein
MTRPIIQVDHEKTQSLQKALTERLPDQALDWFNTALAHITGEGPCADVRLRYSAMARRKIGNNTAFSTTNGVKLKTDEAARIIFLSQLINREPENAHDHMGAAFANADEHEKIAIAKGFDFLDKTGELTNLALTIGRTNTTTLFSALALNNPYPASHYDKAAFNSMVLKSLFMGLDIGGVISLSDRQNPELSRLCKDYQIERELAGRTVPSSLFLAINENHFHK